MNEVIQNLKKAVQTFEMIFKILCIDWYHDIFEPSEKDLKKKP